MARVVVRVDTAHVETTGQSRGARWIAGDVDTLASLTDLVVDTDLTALAAVLRIIVPVHAPRSTAAGHPFGAGRGAVARALTGDTLVPFWGTVRVAAAARVGVEAQVGAAAIAAALRRHARRGALERLRLATVFDRAAVRTVHTRARGGHEQNQNENKKPVHIV